MRRVAYQSGLDWHVLAALNLFKLLLCLPKLSAIAIAEFSRKIILFFVRDIECQNKVAYCTVVNFTLEGPELLQ